MPSCVPSRSAAERPICYDELHSKCKKAPDFLCSLSSLTIEYLGMESVVVVTEYDSGEECGRVRQECWRKMSTLEHCSEGMMVSDCKGFAGEGVPGALGGP